MSNLHYVPVFEFDPNTPARRLDTGELACSALVRSPDMIEDFEEGTYVNGDLAFAYQPHEPWNPETKQFLGKEFEDAGMGFPCRIVGWHISDLPNLGRVAIVYLEIDGAYAIVDRRREVDNDEGTKVERDVRESRG